MNKKVFLGFIMNINQLGIDQEFYIIGITIRTTNKAAINNGTIKNLWQQFFTQSILSKIPNKINHELVATLVNQNSYLRSINGITARDWNLGMYIR